MFATHAVSTVLKEVLDATQCCFEETNPCARLTIETCKQPLCQSGAVNIQVVGEIRFESDNRVPCCPLRQWLDVRICIDVPRCPPDQQTGMRPAGQAMEDTANIFETLTLVIGGVLKARALGDIGQGCANMTAPERLVCAQQTDCNERWETSFSIEITDYCPTVELEPTGGTP